MQLMTRLETIRYLRTSSSSLDRAVKRGRLKPIKIIGKPLFDREQIDKALKAQLYG